MENQTDKLFTEIQEQLQRERNKTTGIGFVGKLIVAIVVAVLVEYQAYGVAAFIAMFFLQL